MLNRRRIQIAGFAGAALLAAFASCGGGKGASASNPSAPPPPPPPPVANCSPAPTSSTSVNVKDAPYGAKGDGVTDDTAAIQKAVDAIGGTGGTVVIPTGTYMVNAVTSIYLHSQMTLDMTSGATLKAITTSSDNYAILRLSNVSDTNVIGGYLTGERSTHTGTTGEQGMGMRIYGGSTRVAVKNVTAQECWGDGFTIEHASQITLCGVVAYHNRRQGLSIVAGDTLAVKNSIFNNQAGTNPESGIDLEPNSGETINNVLISGCTLSNNAGDGIQDSVPLSLTGNAFNTNVTIDGNTMNANGFNTVRTDTPNGIEISNISGHKITNNGVDGNAGDGILLRDGATGCTVTGNTVTNNKKGGIVQSNASGNTISNNTLSGNGGMA